jgi:hypothetical protein
MTEPRRTPWLDLPPGSLVYTRCRRRRTRGNVHNYAYWECPDCGTHPGDSEGPPTATCYNCGSAQYTDAWEQAVHILRITGTATGHGFEICYPVTLLKDDTV